MSHKNCCFLIDTHQLTDVDSDLDVVTSSDEHFLESVERVFESWSVKHMGSSNWRTHETLLMRDGRVVQLCSDTDFQQRDRMAQQWKRDTTRRNAAFTRLSQDTDEWLEKMLLFAMRCAARGLLDRFDISGAGEKIRSMEAREIQNWFLHDLLADIGRMYSPAGRNSPEERIAATTTYEHFCASSLYPFSRRHCPPEQYRCFDLRPTSDEDMRNVAMLITDIRLDDNCPQKENPDKVSDFLHRGQE